MESLLVAGPLTFQVDSRFLVIIIIVVLILLLVGYTIGSRYFGFGPHDVKTIHTFEYTGDAAKKDAPKGEGAPHTRTITTETQTGRTFWDWLAILTISAAIAGVAVYFTYSQGQHQLRVQNREAMESALGTYLTQMSQMMLDDKTPLLKAEPDSAVSLTARAETVAVLNRLDGEHNKIVVDFIKQSGLSGYRVPGTQKETVVRLDETDLNHVDFAHTNLSGLNLRFSELRHTDLHGADLGLSNLTFADLAHANLKDANLRDADLIFADLEDANLEDANFSGVRTRGVDLSGADLTEAQNVTQTQINQAGAGGAGTKLPDGLHKPNWWSEPNATVKPTEENSLAYPRLQVDRLGASLAPIDKNLKKAVGSEIALPQDVDTFGALVYSVQPRGLAHAAGLEAGDIIVKMEGHKPRGLKDLEATVHKNLYEDDDPMVQFTVRRWFFVTKGWQQGVLSARIGDA